jgi:hypothetical protein
MLCTGDGYVHRLIQSKTDGKLVEVPSPAPTCPHGSPSLHHHHRRHHHHTHHRQRSQGEGRLDPLCRSRSGSSAAVAAAGGGACSSGSEAGADGACTVADCPVCADEAAQMKEVCGVTVPVSGSGLQSTKWGACTGELPALCG